MWAPKISFMNDICGEGMLIVGLDTDQAHAPLLTTPHDRLKACMK